MSDRYLIDTNVFIYSFDTGSPRKLQIARDLIGSSLFTGRGVISYQVVQEFLNAALKKFAVAIEIPDLQLYLDNVLAPLCDVFPSIELYHSALQIRSRWQLSFYDALIVASAHAAECAVLYSEDLQDGQVFNKTRVVNPFK